MSKILFIPFSVVGGLLAGTIAKRLFAGLWSLVDRREPPDPRQRDESWLRVVLALLLEGAVFRAVRSKISAGEFRDVAAELPKDLGDLWLHP